MKPPAATYDTAVIGSSPVCLLEALYRDGVGESVIVIDDKPVIGGAWDFSSMDRYACVESCAHILRYHPACYRFLERYLGLRMVPLDPPPVGISCRAHRRPKGARYETWRWKLRYIADRIDHAGLPRTWRNLEHDVLRPLVRAAILAFDQLRGRMPIQEYPIGGTPAMIEALRALIGRSTVALRLATRVNNVELCDRSARLWTDDACIGCRSLVITTQTRLRGIQEQAEHIGPLGDDLRSLQLLVLADDPGPATCSFLELNGHASLRRISDVTRYARPTAGVEHSQKIIAVTFRTGIEPDDHLAQATVHQLKELNVLSPGARLRRHEWRAYKTIAQTHSVMHRIRRKFGGRIDVLHTADLAAAVAMYAPRWKTVLRPYEQAISDGGGAAAPVAGWRGTGHDLAAAA